MDHPNAKGAAVEFFNQVNQGRSNYDLGRPAINNVIEYAKNGNNSIAFSVRPTVKPGEEVAGFNI